MPERFVCPQCNRFVASAQRGSCGTPGHTPVSVGQEFSVGRWVAFLTGTWLAVVACLVWLERAAYREATVLGNVGEVCRLALVSTACATLLVLLVTGQVRYKQWALLRRVRHGVGPDAELRVALTKYMARFKHASAVAWSVIVLLIGLGLWQLQGVVALLSSVLRRF